MKPWNGIFEHYHYKASERLLVDVDGSVYYMTPEGVPALWCASTRLRGHLHRLWQVTRGEAVENLWCSEDINRNR